VSVIDFCLILAAALASSSVYLWIIAGNPGNVIPFVGIGIVAATNSAVVMTVRRNYRSSQARETYQLLSAASDCDIYQCHPNLNGLLL
jgi:hypothetical protein